MQNIIQVRTCIKTLAYSKGWDAVFRANLNVTLAHSGLSSLFNMFIWLDLAYVL